MCLSIIRRPVWVLLLGYLLTSLLLGCQAEGGDAGAEPRSVTPSPPLSSPTVAATPAAVAPTPAIVTLRIWGPAEFDPGGVEGNGALLRQQVSEFEALYPDIELLYEPKPLSGPAALLTYLRSASAVAPGVLPDLIIIPVPSFEEAVQTGLLYPFDSVITESVRQDFYPFATRDTSVDGQWLAVPLALQLEHGVTRTGRRGQTPTTLESFTREDTPTWLFAGQGVGQGEIGNALLLQLLALSDEGMPGPENLPPTERLLSLFTLLQEAQKVGGIPRQVLLLEEGDAPFRALQEGQADLIESNSRLYLENRRGQTGIIYAPIPTLTGRQVTVVDGYLLGLTTDDPRQQQAVERYLEWLLAPARLAAWSAANSWLPARRSALPEAVEDEEYRRFLAERLERGWLRPGGVTWRGFAQVVQEQVRAVMLEQTSPTRAVEQLLQTYSP